MSKLFGGTRKIGWEGFVSVRHDSFLNSTSFYFANGSKLTVGYWFIKDYRTILLEMIDSLMSQNKSVEIDDGTLKFLGKT